MREDDDYYDAIEITDEDIVDVKDCACEWCDAAREESKARGLTNGFQYSTGKIAV